MIRYSSTFLNSKNHCLELAIKVKYFNTMHLGNRIKEILIQRQMSISELARRLPCDRSNMYKILKKKDMDSTLIERISVILNHNFFEELSSDYIAKNNKQ